MFELRRRVGTVAKQISGHKSEAVYRYDVAEEEPLQAGSAGDEGKDRRSLN
jgi:hypothetical protein